jgi:hypothetical protein
VTLTLRINSGIRACCRLAMRVARGRIIRWSVSGGPTKEQRLARKRIGELLMAVINKVYVAMFRWNASAPELDS